MCNLVHRMKISTVPWKGFDAITHVPTTFSRRFSRGFDQAQLLAKKLAYATEIPYISLLKRKDLKAQSLRSYSDRKKNLSVRFSCKKTPPNRILIVDDVCTTGSTLDACAMALLNDGTKSISGIVLGY